MVKAPKDTVAYLWKPGDPPVAIIVVDKDNQTINTYYQPTASDVRRIAQENDLNLNELETVLSVAEKESYHTMYIDVAKMREGGDG